MSSSSCDICTFKFNDISRMKVTCNLCDGVCCSNCLFKFLTETSMSPEPFCLFCNQSISFDFVSENLNKTKFTLYQKFRSNLKFKTQQSMLPGTQDIVNIRLRIKNRKREIRELQNIRDSNILERKILFRELTDLDDKTRKKEIKERRHELQKQTGKIWGEIMALQDEIFNLQRKERNYPENRVVYERPCPSNDCRGFLSSAYKCGTCEKFFCSDCHDEKGERSDETHVCNEENKATISLIKLECKPCPGKDCTALIYKIDGCDHMWCVKCHTPFSWRTLKIIESTNNPEYFRWVRESGGVLPRIDDNECNRFPGVREWRVYLENIDDKKWYPRLQHLLHNSQYLMRELPNSLNADHTELRVKYLMNKIDEKKWKELFLKRNKQIEVDFERYQVLDMFCSSAKDIFMNLKEDKNIDNFTDQYEKLVEFGNRQLSKINNRYSSDVWSYHLKSFKDITYDSV